MRALIDSRRERVLVPQVDEAVVGRRSQELCAGPDTIVGIHIANGIDVVAMGRRALHELVLLQIVHAHRTIGRARQDLPEYTDAMRWRDPTERERKTV